MPGPWEEYQDTAAAPPAAAPAERPPWEQFAPATKGVDAIPTGNDRAPAAERTYAPKNTTLKDKILGLVEAAVMLGTGATTGAATGAAGAAGGAVAMLANGKLGTNEGANLFEQATAEGAEKGTYAPRTPLGQEYGEKAGEFLSKLIPLAALGSVLPKGAVRPATRAVADTARYGLDKGLDAVTPRMDAGRVALAQKAIDAGIPLRPDQVLPKNKYARALGEAADSVPGAGGNAKPAREAFTAGVAKAIDPDSTATAITPDVYDAMMNKSGGLIGEISERTPIPGTSLETLGEAKRKRTPDVKSVLDEHIADFQTAAAENGGVIPGELFRQLRTEVDSARRSATGDMKGALENLIKRLDDAVGQHAAEGDVANLAEARRQYAIGLAIEPLVNSEGTISPGGLRQALRANKDGKRRVARGKAGEIGEYADIGQRFLREEPTSGTAERNAALRLLVDAGKLGGVAAGYIPAAAYNKLGPRVSRAIVERNAARNLREAPPPPAGPAPLSASQTPFEPPRGGGSGGPGPLGDLTPDWETAPGAAAPEPGAAIVDAAGLTPAVGEPTILRSPLDTRPRPRMPEGIPAPELVGPTRARAGVPLPDPTDPAAVRGRAGSEIPAVPGRPDFPDSMTVGTPAEVGRDAATGQAMQGRDATLARQSQDGRVPVPGEAAAPPEAVAPPLDPRLAEVERLKASATSDAARKALEKHAKGVQKEIAAEAEAAKRSNDAADLEQLALATPDQALRDTLMNEAKALRGKEKIPVGEVIEGEPTIADAAPPKKIPVGQATELDAATGLPPDDVKPIPVGEATELAADSPMFDPRMQAIEEARATATSDVVRKTLDEQAAAVQKQLKGEAELRKKTADAVELESAARAATDPALREAFLAKADALREQINKATQPSQVGKPSEPGAPGKPGKEGKPGTAGKQAAIEPDVDPWEREQPLPPVAQRVDELRSMGTVARWAQVGGTLLRGELEDGMGMDAPVIGRTTWIPAEGWFKEMRDALPGTKGLSNHGEIVAAIEKAISGEKLTVPEQRTVDFMRGEIERMRKGYLDAEFGVLAEEMARDTMASGLAAVDTVDVAAVERAAQIDRDAVESAAMRAGDDDVAFMASIKEILGGEDPKKQARAGQPGRSTVDPQESGRGADARSDGPSRSDEGLRPAPGAGNRDAADRVRGGQENAPQAGKRAPAAAADDQLDFIAASDDGLKRVAAGRPAAPGERGVAGARRALDRGLADGTLDADGVSLAKWALDKNPALAEGMSLRVEPFDPKVPARGSYSPASRIVKLFEDKTNPETAAHEILHHTERMMPPIIQSGIRREWRASVREAIAAEADPKRKEALESILDASSSDADKATAGRAAVRDALQKQILTRDEHYQLTSPSEFWAVNGSRILNERFTGRGSWRAQARQWMGEMVEHVKGAVGLRSDAPVLRALNELLDPAKTTGEDRSTTQVTTTKPATYIPRRYAEISRALDNGKPSEFVGPVYKAAKASIERLSKELATATGDARASIETRIKAAQSRVIRAYSLQEK